MPELLTGDLKLIAEDWRRQGAHGDMPAALFESITSGARGWEKRVVKNIAFKSVLFMPDGTVKNWKQIVSDWKYVNSVYGKKTFCYACGKNPIVENCIIRNRETLEEVIIGNLCVIRYLEIEVDGVLLTEAEKREFLTGQMTEARKEYLRQQFMEKCPSVWDDLTKFEDTLLAIEPSLHKSMIRRLRSHGFPGKVLELRWLKFLSKADGLKQAQEFATQKRRERESQVRETMRSRAANRSARMELVRAQRREKAAQIVEMLDEPDFYATAAERQRLVSLSKRMEQGGIMEQTDHSLLATLECRHENIEAGPQPDDDPDIAFLWTLDTEPLTDAERTFRWIVIGKGLIEQGDRSQVNRMKIRYG